MKKILLACPTSEYKRYVLFDWLKYIKEHFGQQCDILLIDNSKNKHFHREIKQTGTAVIHRPPRRGEPLNQVMADCLNLVNNYLKKHAYSHWFSVECDVFPPPGTLDVLLAYDMGITAASYCTDFGQNRKMVYQRAEGTIVGNIQNMTQSESFLFTDGQIKRVLAAGIGCVLIQRQIIAAYQFRTEAGKPKVYADTFFYQDMKLLKQPVYVHTGILCNHKNSNWNEINRRFKPAN